MRALVNYDAQAALKLGLDSLSEISGITIGSVPIETVRDRASFGGATPAQIIAAIPAQAQPEVAIRAAILSSLLTITFSSAPEIAEEIALQSIIAARGGFTEHAPFAISVCGLFKHAKALHEEANVLDTVATTLVKKISSPYVRLGVRTALTCTAHFTAVPPRDIYSSYMQIASDGEFEIADDDRILTLNFTLSQLPIWLIGSFSIMEWATHIICSSCVVKICLRLMRLGR